MSQAILREIESKQMKASLPEFQVGDSVKVKVLIREGKKERTQAFEGMVIAVKGSGINKNFIVRRIFQGVAIERTFMMHSPKVTEVKVTRKGKTRRSKLYFMRNLVGTKATRLKEDTARIARDFQNIADAKAEAKANAANAPVVATTEQISETQEQSAE